MIFLHLLISSMIAKASDPLFEKTYLSAHCRLYNWAGEVVKEFAGSECLLLDDGSLIATSETKITRIKSDYTPLWTIIGSYHHELNWTVDKKNVLAMASKITKIDGVDVRIDVLQKISIDGKLLGSIDSQEILKQTGDPTLIFPFNWDPESLVRAKFEISHFNSFYEIPAQEKKSKMKELVAGNFIANAIHFGSVILSSDLKHVLKKIKFQNSVDQLVHDVQVMSDGELLYFNNEHTLQDTMSGHYSTIEKMDPATGKITFEFKSDPPEMFYSNFCGGIQNLNDKYYLFSHISSGYYLLDKKTKKIVTSAPLFSADSKNLKPNYTLRIVGGDFSEFLKHWQ